jgi:predicted nucleotidyltransferase
MVGINDPMTERTRCPEESLARVLEAWPTVRAAWLFGSAAEGSTGPLSDVDVAVLGCAALSFDERAQMAVELARAVGRPCDVVAVEHASPVLAMEIVRSDRRFLCRDSDGADEWEDFALRRYLGTAGLRRIVYQHMRQDFGSGTR